MAAVQSAPAFALPAATALHHAHPHPHHPLPPGAALAAAAAAAPAPQQHVDDDDSDSDAEDEGDVNDIPWWLQGHAPAPQAHQQGRHARGLAGHGGNRHGHEHGHGRPHDGAGGGPFALLFRQLVVHPVQALARGLGAKTKGGGHGHHHHHHHNHHHGPVPPAAPAAPAPEPTKAEAEAEEEQEEEAAQEEEEPAPVLLVGVPRVYSCGECRTHLASDLDVVSRAFQGRGGRAFLFDKCVNVATGPPEDRLLMTGVHTVADLLCGGCRALLGWKYEKAHEPSQRYKEGRFILERVRLYHEEGDGEGGAHNEGWFSL